MAAWAGAGQVSKAKPVNEPGVTRVAAASAGRMIARAAIADRPPGGEPASEVSVCSGAWVESLGRRAAL